MKVKVKKIRATGQVIAKCSMRGTFEQSFASMKDLRKVWPGAEIVRTEEHDGYTIVYC